MRDDHAVNRASARDRNAIDDAIDRIAEKFETGNERNIEIGRAQLGA